MKLQQHGVHSAPRRPAEQVASRGDALLDRGGCWMGVDSACPTSADRRVLGGVPAVPGRPPTCPLRTGSGPTRLSAWGFFGHQLNLYRTACPGFELLAVGAAALEVAAFGDRLARSAITHFVCSAAPQCLSSRSLPSVRV